jgi:hypothetical protein
VTRLEEHLAGQVLTPHRLESRQRVGARGGVEDDLAVRAGLEEGQEPHRGMCLLPLGVGRVAHPVGFAAGEGLLHVAGPDDDVVAELVEPAGQSAADCSGAEDCDLHGGALRVW